MDEKTLLVDDGAPSEEDLADVSAPPVAEVPGRAPVVVGRSKALRRVLGRIPRVGASDARVLVRGASGTGKELVARLLHEASPRRGRPFVAVNCAAFPEPLVEAELFGHERGAFSGAVAKRDGRFQAAHRGTLFLDEVAELPLTAQAKLLRVLETGTLEPLGTNQSVYVDIRVVSATHRDLRSRVASGLFREDLFYRLRVVELVLPPLREREGDVPLLVGHFLQRFAPDRRPRVTPQALAALAVHPFPGNVRELENAVQQAVVLAGDDPIDLEHLPAEVAESAGAAPAAAAPGAIRPLAEAAADFERAYLAQALRLCGGRRTECARLLGISRKTLWQKLRRHRVVEEGDGEGRASPDPG